MDIQKAHVLRNAISNKSTEAAENKLKTKYLALQDIWKPGSPDLSDKPNTEYIGLIGSDRILAQTNAGKYGDILSTIDLNTGDTISEIATKSEPPYEQAQIWGDLILYQTRYQKWEEPGSDVELIVYNSTNGSLEWSDSLEGNAIHKNLRIATDSNLAYIVGRRKVMVVAKDGKRVLGKGTEPYYIASAVIDPTRKRFILAGYKGEHYLKEFNSFLSLSLDNRQLGEIQLLTPNGEPLRYHIQTKWDLLDGEYLFCLQDDHWYSFDPDTLICKGSGTAPEFRLGEGTFMQEGGILLTRGEFEHVMTLCSLEHHHDYCPIPWDNNGGKIQKINDTFIFISDASIDFYDNFIKERLLLEGSQSEPVQELLTEKSEPVRSYPNLDRIEKFFLSENKIFAVYNNTIARVVGEKLIWEKEQVTPLDFRELFSARR